MGWMEEDSTARNDWKGVTFGGQIETWYKGNSQESVRMTPAKTPNCCCHVLTVFGCGGPDHILHCF